MTDFVCIVEILVRKSHFMENVEYYYLLNAPRIVEISTALPPPRPLCCSGTPPPPANMLQYSVPLTLLVLQWPRRKFATVGPPIVTLLQCALSALRTVLLFQRRFSGIFYGNFSFRKQRSKLTRLTLKSQGKVR